MNIPYGKSCADKLYVLRQEGYVPDHDQNNVLLEEYLHNFHQEVDFNLSRWHFLCVELKSNKKYIILHYFKHSTLDLMFIDLSSNFKARYFFGILRKKV